MNTVVLILLLTAGTLAQRPYFTRIGESRVGQKGRPPRRIQHPAVLTRWQTKPNRKPGPPPDPADPVDPPDHVPRARQRVPEFTPLGERGQYIPVHVPSPISPDPVPAPITARESAIYPVQTPATGSVYGAPPTPVGPISAGSVGRNLPPTRTKSGPPPSHRMTQTAHTTNKARSAKRLISSGTQAADRNSGGNVKGNPNISPSAVPKRNPNLAPSVIPKGNQNMVSSAAQKGTHNAVPSVLSQGRPREASAKLGNAALSMLQTRTKTGPTPVSQQAVVQRGNRKSALPEHASGSSISTGRNNQMPKHVFTGQTVPNGNTPLERYPKGNKPVAAPPTQSTTGYRQVPVTAPGSPPVRSNNLSDKRPLSDGTLMTLAPSRTKVGPPPLREPGVTIRPTPKTEPERIKQKKALPARSKAAVIPPTRTKSGPSPRRNKQRTGRQNIPSRKSQKPADPIVYRSRDRDSLIVRGPPSPSFRQHSSPGSGQTRPEAKQTRPEARQTRPDGRQTRLEAGDTRPGARQGPPSPVYRQARPEPLARPPTRTKSLGNLAGPGPVYAPIVPMEPITPPTINPPTTAFMVYDQPEVKKEEEEES